MSKVLVRFLDRLTGSYPCDHDSVFLTRFLNNRDEQAFAALMHRHGPLVYGTCLRILGNRADSDDAFQAVFFVLARRADVLKLDRSISGWLHGVAVRVAKKLRRQIVQRRLRDMAAARSEQAATPELHDDFWAIIDEEVARLAPPLRQVLVLCDLSGQSHSRTAAALGLAKGTITKRLAKAREALAARLRQRGFTLGAAALSTLMATQTPAAVPVSLQLTTARHAIAFSIRTLGGSATARNLAEGVMRSLRFGTLKVWLATALLLGMLTGGLMLAGASGETSPKPTAAKTDAKPDVAKVGTVWRESFTTEYEQSLPVSIAFSADGQTLLTGDTSGEVMAVKFPSDRPTYRWKTKIDGSHAAVAYSANQKQVYATTANGVRILDAATGKEVARIDAPDSNPIAIGVFPNKVFAADFTQSRLVFGNAHGYFIKSWADGKLVETLGGIETTTLDKTAKAADVAAVPLAVDPKGRSAIMTGPRDEKGRNVLWAYVCGDHDKDSPGNRVLVGHSAAVVGAAWAKAADIAVTGDATGGLIVWDTSTMKQLRRVELNGRVLAVAVSNDGKHLAACVRGTQGGEVYAWETAKPVSAMRPIDVQPGDFGSAPFASLTFNADGKRLAGCVIDKKWQEAAPRAPLSGQVHVWELAPEPKGQPAPKQVYAKPLPKGSSPSFVVLNNYSILTSAAKEGALDFRNIDTGEIQARLVLGKFAIGGMKLSSDRKWLAIEQHALTAAVPGDTFDVGVYDATLRDSIIIPACTQILDVASGGKIVAVVREKRIELWDRAAAKKLKAAPFEFKQLDAAQFSPDGRLLALSDSKKLVLWRWEENTVERTELGGRVNALTFTPDGKFLAEGAISRPDIEIRDVATRKVVQKLDDGFARLMKLERIAYTQGGRVLIARDTSNFQPMPGSAAHRINLWDTVSGLLAHQIVLPAGLWTNMDVSPNGRYLAAMLDDGDDGIKLSVWRLDGEKPATVNETPPAATRPR